MRLGVAGNRYESSGEVVSLRSGIARVESLEDLVEQGFGLRLKLFQADLMLAAGCGSVHGVHKMKALQGALPSFDWCVYRKLVGVLLQCLLNGVKLLGDSCGWAKRGRQMHVRGGLLEFAAYLLLADKLRHLLHVFRIGRNVDRRFDGIGRRPMRRSPSETHLCAPLVTPFNAETFLGTV